MMPTLTRRSVLRVLVVGSVGASLAITVAGCDEEDLDAADAAPRPVDCSNSITAEIANNHGHQLTVPPQDVQARPDATYDITGGADHGHDVTITADMFAALARDGRLRVMSSDAAGHAHELTLTCV